MATKVTLAEFPDGLRCADCDTELAEGAEYESVREAEDINILVCPDCATTRAAADEGEPAEEDVTDEAAAEAAEEEAPAEEDEAAEEAPADEETDEEEERTAEEGEARGAQCDTCSGSGTCPDCGGSGSVEEEDTAEESDARIAALEDKVEKLTRKLAEATEVRAFEARFGKIGGKEIRELPTIAEVRDSGAGEGQFTVKGHAAVFNKNSMDLGFFTEDIDANAFDNVLSRDPDVHFNWDHDMRWVFARTRNRTLDLKVDEQGLAYWARVAPVSYADDLRALMEGGYVDQASFCFTVARDEWRIEIDEDGNELIHRTILEVGELFDVCVTARGAYPDASSLPGTRAYVRSFVPEGTASTPADVAEVVEEKTNTASAVSIARAKARAKRLKNA